MKSLVVEETANAFKFSFEWNGHAYIKSISKNVLLSLSMKELVERQRHIMMKMKGIMV